MKKLVITLFVALFMANYAAAQTEPDKTDAPQMLFSKDSKVTGLFFEMNNSYSQLNQKETYMPGLTGGVVMDKNFYIGVRFKSLSLSETRLNYNEVLSEECYLNGGFAGLYMETGRKSKNIFHITFPLTIGGGGAYYLSKNKYNEVDDDEIDFKRKELSSSTFFVIEPGINLEMNVTSFMKFTTGFSYRWLYGLDLQNTNRKALNSGSFNIGLKLGKFN